MPNQITKTARAISNTTILRRNNRNYILRYLYEQSKEITKQELANEVGMSLPTVSQNVTELIEKGLVEYRNSLQSSGGRKPKGIALVKDAKIGMGISISANHLRMIAVNLLGEEIAFARTRLEFEQSDEYFATLKKYFLKFIAQNQIEETKILGVTITMPGIVNKEKMTVEFAPTLRIKNINLDFLQELLPYPVTLENDANAGAFAEYFREKSMASIAYLFVEKGVGGSILINGNTYHGRDNRSGEFGHMIIEPGGGLCSCGRRGCLEYYCTTDRLGKDFGISLDEFFSGLGKSQKLDDAFYEYLSHLADGISLIQRTLNCDVIIGGNLSKYMAPHMELLHTLVIERSPFVEDKTSVRLGRHPSKEACLGGALQHVFDFIENI